jgi:hypothetical protein
VKKPKPDSGLVSSARTLAGHSSDRKCTREGGGTGNWERKGADRSQQQAAGCEGGSAGDVEDKRRAGRAGAVEYKRKAGREGGASRRRRGQARGRVTRTESGASSAARRCHSHYDAASIAVTADISSAARYAIYFYRNRRMAWVLQARASKRFS